MTRYSQWGPGSLGDPLELLKQEWGQKTKKQIFLTLVSEISFDQNKSGDI